MENRVLTRVVAQVGALQKKQETCLDLKPRTTTQATLAWCDAEPAEGRSSIDVGTDLIRKIASRSMEGKVATDRSIAELTTRRALPLAA